MRTLRIALLGVPQIEVDGEALVVDTRKATALLAYLALSGGAQSRGRLAELLWPDTEPERARAALRRTLSTLRAAIGDERIASDRLTVALRLDGAYFDLAEFRRVAADPTADSDSLAAAAALHRDELLAGFYLRDSAVFDDWQREIQELIRRERAGVLDRLAERRAGDGRLDEAIAAARVRLALDELHEPTHQRLIELYSRSGRRGAALAQYRDCVLVLDRELGVAPLAETTELYNAINGQGSIGAGSDPVEPTRSSTQLTLVGRQPELDAVLAARAQLGERGGLVLLEGESGVGKTRLASEALLRFADEVAVVAIGAHAGEQTIAYGVITQLLRGALAEDLGRLEGSSRSELARLLPELGAPPAGGLAEPGAQVRLLETVSRVLASSLGSGRGVVFVDDLQWCDPASLEALIYVARRLEQRPLLLLTARRTDEPDRERRYSELAALGRRVQLMRLERPEVVLLAAQQGLDDRDAERIFEESEGLPLLVAELLAEDLARDAGARGVRAVLEARLDRIGDGAAQVLGAAALIGRRFDADTLRLASGRSEEEVAAALDELAAHGLVVERDEAYDFAHERLRSLAEERVGLARRRLLHRRLAGALGERHGDPALVARHLELAGDERAAGAHATAGERARALLAPVEAIEHFESAIALGHPDAASLHEAIGDLQTRRGAYADALAAYSAALAHGLPDDAGRLEHKLGGVHERRGELELADSHYEQALARGADPATVQADRSRVAWRMGEIDRARTLGFEALELADAAGAMAPAARANNILGLLGCGRGYLERSLELARDLPDASIRIAVLNNLARDDVASGRLEGAEALLLEALALCEAHGDVHHEAALRNNLADILHSAGRGEEAMSELKRAVSAFTAVGGSGQDIDPAVWSLVEW